MLNKLTIKYKLLILTIVSLTLLGGIISIVAINSSTDILMKKSYNKLTAKRESKKQQLKSFFDQRVADIKVLARSSSIRGIMGDLEDFYEELEFDINGKFPVENKLVQRATKTHEEFFQGFMKDYGYYDVFVVNSQHGHVIYTAAKESDYGANLKTGPLKTSGLGQAYHKAMELKKPVFIDMKPYAPSNNAPAMFLATPVYYFANLEAVLIFQISDEAINKIMKFRIGYGESQEDYLVGSDRLMRSDSYLDPKHHNVQASFDNPEKGKVVTDASKAVFAGKSGTDIIVDYNGNPVLSSYTSIQVDDGLVWALLSEIDEAEVLHASDKMQTTIIISAVVVLVIIIAISLFLTNQSLVRPINIFRTTMTEIGDQKDLTRKLDTEYAPQEIKEMAESFNILIAQLRDTVDSSKGS